MAKKKNTHDIRVNVHIIDRDSSETKTRTFLLGSKFFEEETKEFIDTCGYRKYYVDYDTDADVPKKQLDYLDSLFGI